VYSTEIVFTFSFDESIIAEKADMWPNVVVWCLFDLFTVFGMGPAVCWFESSSQVNFRNWNIYITVSKLILKQT